MINMCFFIMSTKYMFKTLKSYWDIYLLYIFIMFMRCHRIIRPPYSKVLVPPLIEKCVYLFLVTLITVVPYVKEINGFYRCFTKEMRAKKKLDPRWLDSPGYSGLRRRSSHADRKTPRIPAPPIHSGNAAPWDELVIDLCFERGADKGAFFISLGENPRKQRAGAPHLGLQPAPRECYWER